jgi:trans-aconitate methyltransferase
MKLTDIIDHTYDQFDATTYEAFYGQFDNYNGDLARLIRSVIEQPEFVVDLGCGSGLFAQSISQHFNPKVLMGLDPNRDMLDTAKGRTYQTTTTFIEDLADKLPDYLQHNELPDVIISKSAFHHFEHAFPMSQVMQYIKAGGCFITVERTERSARSYPLFSEGTDHWANFFAEQASQRIKQRIYPDSSLSLGQQVTVTAKEYFHAIKSRQLSFIWPYAADLVSKWADQALLEAAESVSLFEEFQVSIFNKNG